MSMMSPILRKLEQRVTAQSASLLVDEVRAHWTDVPEVLGYLPFD